MKTVIIFGYTGYVGSNLYHYMRRCGYTVVGFNRENAPLLEMSSSALSSLLIHYPNAHYVICSAITRTVGDTAKIALQNIQMIHTIISAIKDSFPRTVCYLSASDVYGLGGSHIAESIKLEPISMYGSFKIYAEHLLRIELGHLCPLHVLRIPGVFSGDNDKTSLISRLINRIQNNETVTLTNSGITQREYVSIRILQKVIFESFNFASSLFLNLACLDSVSMLQLVEMLFLKLNFSKKILLDNTISNRDHSLTYDKSLMIDTFPWIISHTIEAELDELIFKEGCVF